MCNAATTATEIKLKKDYVTVRVARAVKFIYPYKNSFLYMLEINSKNNTVNTVTYNNKVSLFYFCISVIHV